MIPWEHWLYLVSSVTAWTLAVFVYLVQPNREQNRYLALFLLVLGCTFFLILFAREVLPAPASHAAGGLGGWVFWAIVPFFHALWLSTLPTPLVAPLRKTWVRALILVVVCLPVVAMLGNADRMMQEWVGGGPYRTIGTIQPFLQFGTMATALYALAASWSAWRVNKPGSELRRQAAWIFAAFGLRDVVYATTFGSWLFGIGSEAGLLNTIQWIGTFFVTEMVFASLLVYAILKHQLFDIDLRIKWTIHRGTLVGVFLAVFFIVGVIAENWLTARFGLALGGVAAGLLLFALTPLQRFADRIADVAMPNVQDTAEYRLVRKRQVYRAALEGAFLDGAVSDRERAILARLQDELGLTGTEAHALERDLAGAI